MIRAIEYLNGSLEMDGCDEEREGESFLEG